MQDFTKQKEGPGRFLSVSETETEINAPNSEILALTRKIVEQNGKVLEMNERLLALLTSPSFLEDDEALEYSGNTEDRIRETLEWLRNIGKEEVAEIRSREAAEQIMKEIDRQATPTWNTEIKEEH